MLLAGCSFRHTDEAAGRVAEANATAAVAARPAATGQPTGTAAARATDTQPTPAPTPAPADAAARSDPAPVETSAAKRVRIPARFVGSWAPDAAQCTRDDGSERITITPERVGFFETVGDVRDVFEEGGSTRITVRERVGDQYPVYAIMISLADGGRGLNYINQGKRRLFVKCPG